VRDGATALPAAARFLARRALIPIWRTFEQQDQFVADASHELRAPLTLCRPMWRCSGGTLRPFPPTGREWAGEISDHEGNADTRAFLMLPQEDGEIIEEMAKRSSR